MSGSAACRVNQIFFARCLPRVGLENIRLQGLFQSNDARIVAGEGCCEFAQHALRETVQTVLADAAKEGEYNPTGRAQPVAERRKIKHGGREIESAIDIEVLEDVRTRSNHVGNTPDRTAPHPLKARVDPRPATAS